MIISTPHRFAEPPSGGVTLLTVRYECPLDIHFIALDPLREDFSEKLRFSLLMSIISIFQSII